MTNALATVDTDGLDEAVLRAAGLDKVPAPQRKLAIGMAERYELDLMLKHLIIVDGRPYITRDGLIHVALRSGQFDGIEVTDPVLDAGYWRCRATVYRKDMSRGITYPGRYPEKGTNAKFGPEMAIKVAEVMALRRAFDVSAPVIEERWDMEDVPTEVRRSEPRSLNDKIASQRAAIEARAVSAPEAAPPPVSGATDEPAAAQPAAVQGEAARAPAASPAPVEQCPSESPYDNPTRCQREAGHPGTHRNRDKESWS